MASTVLSTVGTQGKELTSPVLKKVVAWEGRKSETSGSNETSGAQWSGLHPKSCRNQGREEVSVGE